MYSRFRVVFKFLANACKFPKYSGAYFGQYSASLQTCLSRDQLVRHQKSIHAQVAVTMNTSFPCLSYLPIAEICTLHDALSMILAGVTLIFWPASSPQAWLCIRTPAINQTPSHNPIYDLIARPSRPFDDIAVSSSIALKLFPQLGHRDDSSPRWLARNSNRRT
jgi:hypothetical protein